MRNLIVICLILLTSVIAQAQESAAELKNAGNAALTAKDYATAAEKYEAYFATGEEDAVSDFKTVYNLATCYDKLGKDAEATAKYNVCIENGYRADMASYKVAGYKKEAGDVDAYIAAMTQIIKDYPKSRYRKSFYKIVTTHYNKLAQVPYNAANKLATEAATSGDAGIYLSKMRKAVVKFGEAKDGFKKTLEIEPTNKAALGALATIADQIKSYESYKKELEANQK